MQKTLSATLYEDNNPNASRSISVEIKDGLVRFEQQDIGPLCEEMFGDSDYEWIIFDLPVEQLRSAMGGQDRQGTHFGTETRLQHIGCVRQVFEVCL